LGIPRRSTPNPGARSRRGGRGLGRRSGPAEMDRHLLPGSEGELRLQRLYHLLGPGPLVAPGPYPALVALVAPPRPRRAGSEDHPEPPSARDPPNVGGGLRPPNAQASDRRTEPPPTKGRRPAPGRLSQIGREVCLLG